MRNKYGGMCYRCGRHVEAGAGHFERFRGGWRVQHADCAIKHRGTPDPKREADRVKRLHWLAGQTGRKAQKARAELRLLKQEAGMADEDWKHLKFYGYAPGGYLCRCGECGQQHEADKRAATCRSCAEKLHAEHREVCWTLIFFREGGFYPIDVLDPKACGKSLREQAAEHAAVNPGTQRVEDINGNVLWDAED